MINAHPAGAHCFINAQFRQSRGFRHFLRVQWDTNPLRCERVPTISRLRRGSRDQRPGLVRDDPDGEQKKAAQNVVNENQRRRNAAPGMRAARHEKTQVLGAHLMTYRPATMNASGHNANPSLQATCHFKPPDPAEQSNSTCTVSFEDNEHDCEMVTCRLRH